MRVDGWHTAIRGLATTFYAYVKGASCKLLTHVGSITTLCKYRSWILPEPFPLPPGPMI